MTAWPRMMRKQMAAQYCQLSLAGFEREMIAGRLPTPVLLDGKEHWCIRQLDKALDAITGAAVPDYREKFRERIRQKAA